MDRGLRSRRSGRSIALGRRAYGGQAELTEPVEQAFHDRLVHAADHVGVHGGEGAERAVGEDQPSAAAAGVVALQGKDAPAAASSAGPLPEMSESTPPTLQWPAAPADTELTCASPPAFSPAVPGTSTAARQVPATSLATNACSWPEVSP